MRLRSKELTKVFISITESNLLTQRSAPKSFWQRYRPARAVKPSNPIRPRLEVLEDRGVPSIDMVTNLSGSAATPGSSPYEVAQVGPGERKSAARVGLEATRLG
jgi:hypothetical protein